MGKLQLGSTSELRENINYRIFLYGENRSGKTHFTGTWPRPLYIVPELATNEMRTLSDQNFPMVFFDSMANCYNQVLEITRMVKARKFIGGYIPRTIVFDNLSTSMTMFEQELKMEGTRPKRFEEGKEKMDWGDWGKQKALITAILSLLHSTPAHVIWISHPKLITISRKVGDQTITEQEGGFNLSGDAKNFIPGNCDLLYAEAVDRGVKGPGYYIHGKKKGVWPAGVRLNGQQAPFGKIGPDPHYDDLAEILGLPSLEEEETDEYYEV